MDIERAWSGLSVDPGLRRLKIKKMGRLFWKLFSLFWLAMMSGFNFGPIVYSLTLGGTRPLTFGLAMLPLFLGAILSFFFALLLAWYISKPLKHLRQALSIAGYDEFKTRIQPLMGTRRDEIVDLAKDFDAMAERLQNLTQARRHLLHDISHELRSPLNRIQVAVGLCHQTPTETQDMLARIAQEAERLESMIEELMVMEQIESGDSLGAGNDMIDLLEILNDIVEDASFEAQAKSCSIQASIQGKFVARVKGELIYRALENVIRNAVKFTVEGSAIEVAATVDEAVGQLTIRVIDQGPGVQPHLLESIFEPFYRVTGDLKAFPGFGLGLAISRRAVVSHGGTVNAHTHAAGGLEVVIVIPNNSR